MLLASIQQPIDVWVLFRASYINMYHSIQHKNLAITPIIPEWLRWSWITAADSADTQGALRSPSSSHHHQMEDLARDNNHCYPAANFTLGYAMVAIKLLLLYASPIMMYLLHLWKKQSRDWDPRKHLVWFIRGLITDNLLAWPEHIFIVVIINAINCPKPDECIITSCCALLLFSLSIYLRLTFHC